MLFYSFSFIAFFMPVVLAGFFIIHKHGGNTAAKLFLFLASLFFYGYWNPIYLPLLFGSMAFNYLVSEHVKKVKSKSFLWLGVIANFCLLGFFKYMDFFIENVNLTLGTEWSLLHIALPLGISFFTFQQVAYLVDSYKSKTGKDSFLDYGLFVSFFPQLIAGPIVHWREMMPQFDDLKQGAFSAQTFLKGVNIFALGFLKKVLIADNLSFVTDKIFSEGHNLDLVSSWLGGICFTLQIYFDFSAYSEMAIGAALMMNIKLPLNFNSPYKARNINDFWNRWHITLTRWFFQYTFLPLAALWAKGGSLSLNVLIATTMIIFTLSGLWHGAQWTFVLWGAMHGLALVAYRVWQANNWSMPKVLAHSLTLLFLIVAAVVFRAPSIEFLGDYAYAMVGGLGLYHPDNYISPYISVLYVIFALLFYIVLRSPNVFEIVGYQHIKADEGRAPVFPLFDVKTMFLRMESGTLVTIAYGIVFGFTLLHVLQRDTIGAFIYFDFQKRLMTGSEPQQHKAFSKIVLFLCSVIFVFVFSAVANYVIDPTGAFFQRERILRPAIAPTVAQMSRVLNGSETECHDFLIGTSVVLVLDTTVLKQEPCKLTFYGKGIQSYIKGLNLLLDQGIKINSLIVFISYDQYYNQDRFDYTKSYILGLDYPSDLYETLFYLKTLLFLDLYETIRQISLPPSTDQFPKWNEDLRLSDLSIFSSLKYRWDTTVPNVPWPSQAVRNNAVERLGPSTLVTENREYQPEAFKVLLQQIVTLSRENNFKVTFVRPPNFYKNIVATHKREFLDSYRQLLEVSEYYDFSFDIQYLRDPSLWIDMNHYNQEVASRVMDDLSHQSDDPKFGKKITKENMDEHLEALERDVYTYFLDQKPYPPNTIVHETWLDTQKQL